MPIPLAPITISAGVPQTVSIGTSGTAGAVVIGNESPFALMASGGSGGIWVYAQMADRLNCDTSAFNGNITLTAQNYLSNSTQAPSFQVYLTVYAPGEPIPGTYPCALSRMFNVGNSIVSNSPANVFEQDLFTPFVYTGYVATKDGVISNQLDVTAGIAFLRQNADNSLLRIANNATAFLTTTPSTTYFLDLNPDGTWSFATTHSGAANHLPIAQVTTDGSGNILAVTDERTTNTTLLGAMTPDFTRSDTGNVVEMPALGLSAPDVGAGALGVMGFYHPANAIFFNAPFGGASDLGFFFSSYKTGTGLVTPLSIGGQFNGALSWMANTGAFGAINGQPTAGSFGVPVIVAQAINVNITDTALHTICSFTPSANGVYRVSMVATLNNGTNGQKILLSVSYIDPNPSGTTVGSFFSGVAGNYNIYSGAGMTVTVNNQSIPTNPMIIYAKAGVNILVRYQDIGGTPNDFVSGMIERLS